MLDTHSQEFLIDRLLDETQKNAVLMHMYNGQRDRGATPQLCSIFINRIERLLSELQSKGCSGMALAKLKNMEDDLGDMGYFDIDLTALRKSIEHRRNSLAKARD